MKIFKSILVFILLCNASVLIAQKQLTISSDNSIKSDTVIPTTQKPTILKHQTDSTANKNIFKQKHNPKTATLRSAILPGWGQAYNKEYWKIPIIYGVLAIPTATFIYNNNWYHRTKNAYDLLYKASDPNATPQDIDNLKYIHPKLQGFSLSSLQTFRNNFRKDRDYSVLWFVVAWGLNVVDATVFAHLKGFDVSDNLSMKIQPSINPINQSKGLSLVFNFKNSSSVHKVNVR
jgi:hypothetical protein